MPSFVNRLAGSWSPHVTSALSNYQFHNPTAPGEVQQLGNVFGSLLNKGAMTFNDDTGTASINPSTGQLELMGKNFGIGINANRFDPGAQIKFQFGKQELTEPGMMNQFLEQGLEAPGMSPARQELEQNLEQYQSNNPYWYRP